MNALDKALTVTTEVGAFWDSAPGPSSGCDGWESDIVPRQSSVPRPGLESLTRAEAAVARLAAEGNTDRQIAEKLFISPHTAHTHLRHAYLKSLASTLA